MKDKGGYSFHSSKHTIWASYSMILSKVWIPECGKLLGKFHSEVKVKPE